MAMATTVSAADIANTKRARVEPIALLYKSDEAIKLSNPGVKHYFDGYEGFN
jgi:hypothetical protein